MWLRKKKDLLRLLMLVVVEAIFDKIVKVCTTEKTFSAIKCRIIRHCDRNDCIYNFMKKIHIVEHKPVQKGKNIDLLAFFLNKFHLNRIIPVQIESTLCIFLEVFKFIDHGFTTWPPNW